MKVSLPLKAALIFFLLAANYPVAISQNIAINTTGAAPNTSAMLDIDAIGKGLLIPRMTNAERNGISSPATSLLVYQTDGTPGYYYNSGTPGSPVWSQISSALTSWQLTGNTLTGTLPASPAEWFGSVNAADVIFKTNNTERLRIMSSGTISWGGSLQNNLTTDQGGSIELGGTNSIANPVASGVPYIDFHFGTGAGQDYNARIINAANNRLDFITSSANAMSINTSNVGIGTTSPSARLDVNGSLALREGTALSLANGANNDVSLGDFSFFRITGPTAAFTISGLTGGVDGRIITLYNTTSQVMTLANDNAGSSASNRIYTMVGSDITAASGPSITQLQYNANQARWIIIGGQKLGGTGTQWSLGGNSINAATDFIGTTNAQDWVVKTNNSERMRILSDGNVGIGTSPTGKLDVLAGAARTGTHATTPSFYVTGSLSSGQTGPSANNIEFRHDNGSQGIGFGFNTIYQTGSNANQELNLLSRGTGHITLNAFAYSTGNVGIGCTDPDNKLEIRNGDLELQNDNIDAKIRFHDPGDYWYSMGIDRSDAGKFKINYGGNIGDNNHLTMLTNGNVGIGNTTAVAKLHVGAGEGDGITIGNPDDAMGLNGGSHQIRFYGYRDVVSNAISAKISAERTNVCCGWLSQGTDLAFYTNNGLVTANADNSTERMRITDNGTINIKRGVFFDCPDCGSTTNVNGTGDWGDMTIQGRVLSANSNIHLSPPNGFKVIVNTSYRAAGGATGSSGIDIEDGGIRMRKNYYYFQRYCYCNCYGCGSGGYDLGTWDFCAVAQVGFKNNQSVSDEDDDVQCAVYPDGYSYGEQTNYTATFTEQYNSKRRWWMYLEAFEDTNGVTCAANCMNFE